MNTTSGIEVTVQHNLVELWETHEAYEFVAQDAEAAIGTMTEDTYVHLVPVEICARGKEAVKNFYSAHLIGKMPLDIKANLISRTVGDDQLVDERFYSFTHTREIFLLPGVPPTNKAIKLPIVIIVGFRDGKIAYERLYWDQASVLKQVGLLPEKL